MTSISPRATPSNINPVSPTRRAAHHEATGIAVDVPIEHFAAT